MRAFLAAFDSQAYALLRIVTGFLFLLHGAQKLFGVPVPAFPGMPFHVHYIAGPIELIGGTLVMIGLFTRYAAFLCSGLMAAAYFMAHQPKGLLPIQNGGELAALYAFVLLYIATRGGGIWSADAARGAD